MTENEAIKMLKSKMDGSVDTSYEWVEAVRLAIKALEQQTTRPTARWERLVDDFKKCSKCGRPVKLYRNYKYCPGCGSEMSELKPS